MNYTLNLFYTPFRRWLSFKSWKGSDYSRDTNFVDYLAIIYPDLIESAHWRDMSVTFKSEEHYTWFILQQ